MAKKNFLLLSLDDSQIKDVANVVSNASCKKILDYLADHDATESELAEILSIPISTVHYNLQQLQKAGLVIADEYHYSKKGREVLHYKLANKYIIITPKKTTGILGKLKNIFPIIVVLGVIGVFLEMFTRPFAVAKSLAATGIVPRAAESFPKDAPVSAPLVASHIPSIALWFCIGAFVAIVLIIIFDSVKKE
jgi:DNA-binding transcriptional ArsR family regulator